MYAAVPDLWADMLSVFPDAGDAVGPQTIHNEAVATLVAAVDSEAYRRFRELNVEDPYQRAALAEQMRQQVVAELTPDPATVTTPEARELSRTSADQFGRTAEDSRYLAAYALGAEWEYNRLDGSPMVTFEQFVAGSAPEMHSVIDTAFRRNLGAFDEIIRQTTGAAPLCSAPFPPGTALPPEKAAPLPEEQPVRMTPELHAEIQQWFKDQESREQTPVQAAPAQSADRWTHEAQQIQPQAAPQQEQQGSFWKRALSAGKDLAIDYITDPNGEWEARRAAKNLAEAEAWRRERAERILDAELRNSEAMAEFREKRNKKARGFWG